MALEVPASQTPIPGDLQARIENALNLVTSLEAEQARLSRMIGTGKAEINDLHIQKKDLESQVRTGASELGRMLESIKAASTQLSKAEAELKSANSELEKSRNGKREIDSMNASVSKILGEEKERLESFERSLNDRDSKLRKDEDDHGMRVERLREAFK